MPVLCQYLANDARFRLAQSGNLKSLNQAIYRIGSETFQTPEQRRHGWSVKPRLERLCKQGFGVYGKRPRVAEVDQLLHLQRG